MPIDMALLVGALVCFMFAYPGFGSTTLTAIALAASGVLSFAGVFLYTRQYVVPHKKMRVAILAVRSRVEEMLDNDLTMFAYGTSPLSPLILLRMEEGWVIVEFHDWTPYGSKHIARRWYRINSEGVMKRGFDGENLPRHYSSWCHQLPTLREFEALLHELQQCSPRREVSRRT